MNIREISDQVLALLEQGESRANVYQKLTALSPDDAGKIAYAIASVPERDMRRKYIKLNAILCIVRV